MKTQNKYYFNEIVLFEHFCHFFDVFRLVYKVELYWKIAFSLVGQPHEFKLRKNLGQTTNKELILENKSLKNARFKLENRIILTIIVRISAVELDLTFGCWILTATTVPSCRTAL
jgi:hypothetical protein